MAKKKNGGDFFSRVEAFEKKHDKTPAQRQARQNRYIRRQARTPVFRNGAERAVYNTAHKAYRTAARAIRKYSKAYEKSPEYKYRQRVMNRDDAVSRAGRKVIRKLYKNDFGRGVLGAAHGLASGVTWNVGDLAARAEGYKDYDAYHRAHTKYHALTKEQEKKLKSSKAYKRGAVVGDLASYATGYAAAGKAIAKGATKVVEKKAAKSLVEHAAEHGAEALGKGAVKRAAVRGAEKAATKTARKTSGIVGKAVGKMVKADVKAETKAAVKSAGGKISRKELNKAVEKRVANMTGKEARKYSRRAAERVAKNVAKDAIGDLTVGASMDVANELKNGVKPVHEGKDGKLYVNGRFVRDMGVNAATNIVTGGLMDTVPGMVKGVAKDVKGGKKTVERIVRTSDGKYKIKKFKVAANEGEEAVTHAAEQARNAERSAKGARTKRINKFKNATKNSEEWGAMNRYSDWQKANRENIDRLESLRKKASGGDAKAAKEYDQLSETLSKSRDKTVYSSPRVEAKRKLAQSDAFKDLRNAEQKVSAKGTRENNPASYFREQDFVKHLKDNNVTIKDIRERAAKNNTSVGEELTREHQKFTAEKVRGEFEAKKMASESVSSEPKVAAAKVEQPKFSTSKVVDDNLSDEARGYLKEHNLTAEDVTKRSEGVSDKEFAKEVSDSIGQRALNDANGDMDAAEDALERYRKTGEADREASERVPTGEKVTLDNGKTVDVYKGMDVTRGGDRGVGGSQGTFKGENSDMKKNIKRWQNLSKDDEAAVNSFLDEHYGEKSQMSVKELKASFESDLDANGPEFIMQNLRTTINDNKQFSQRDLYYAGRMCQYAQKALEETGDSVYAEMLAESRTALSIGGSEAGKTLQAIQNFYKNTPAGRKMTIETAINRLGNHYNILDLSERIDKKLIDAVSNAADDDALEIAEKNLRDAIWGNIPATWRDKLDAWRYTAMLSSPKTHVRNLVGNAAVLPLRGARNLVEQPIEKALGGRLEAKTKAFVRLSSKEGKDYLKVAKEVADSGVIDSIMNGSTKFSVEDKATKLNFLKKPERRSNFNHKWSRKAAKPLEWFQRGVGNALEKVDELFIRYNFYTQFASYCKRNGIKPSEFNNLPKAKQADVIGYASNEALVATYREDNAVSAWISRQRNEFAKSNTVAAKVGKLLLDSAVPFSKTPINILKTSADFSPVGLFNGMRNIIKSNGDTKQLEKALKDLAGFSDNAIPKQTKELIYKTCKNDELAKRLIDSVENVDATKMRAVLNDPEYQELMKQAKISGTDQKMLRKGIDQLASGIVGTPLVIAGFLLGKNGIAQGVFDQNSKLDRYRRGQGEQEYSVNILGKSYTYNWAAPLALPFAIGVNAGNATVGDPYGIAKGLALTSAWAKAASSVLDPVTTMSVLSGVQNIFSTNYSGGGSAVTTIGKNMAENYLSQFIPTLGGQIAQSLCTDKQLSTASTNAESTVREYVNTFNYWKSRIPLINRTLPTSYDMYGRSTDSPNVANALFAPWNSKDIRTNAVDKEIRSLYKRTGDDSVLPQNVNSREMNNFTFNAGGKAYHMSQDDYAEYKKVKGSEILNGLDKLFKSDKYKKMSINDKKDAIGDIYTAAKEKARKNYLMSQGVSETDYDYEYSLTSAQRKGWKSAKKAGVSKDTFMKYKVDSTGSGRTTISKAFAAIDAGAKNRKQAGALVTNGKGKISKETWENAKTLKKSGITSDNLKKYSKLTHGLKESAYAAKAYAAIKSGARNYNQALAISGSNIYGTTWDSVVTAYNNGVSYNQVKYLYSDKVQKQMAKTASNGRPYRTKDLTVRWIENHYGNKPLSVKRTYYNMLKYKNWGAVY